MLETRVIELLDEYELGDLLMTSYDVMDELQIIVDEEPYDDSLTDELQEAIDKFVLDRRDYERYCGHCSNGSEDFIEKIKVLVGYEN